MKKEAFSISLLFWAWQNNLHLRIFAKITKLSLQQVGKTSWQIGIYVMPGGLDIFAK
jgi:phage tail sheath protein FI